MSDKETAPRINNPLELAAKKADWEQVVQNGGPPCFHFEGELVEFCLRAQRWPGHAGGEWPNHKFVPLEELLRMVAVECTAPALQVAHEGRLSGQQITDMMRQWHKMQDDPYYPSDPKIFSLLLEVSARRIEAATPQVTPGVQWFVTRRTVKQAFHLSADPTPVENDILHEFLGATKWESDRDGGLLIHTLEGVMRADSGDWIIRGVKGEFYPCKPDIFAVNYEPFKAGNGGSIETAIDEIGQIVLDGLPKGVGFVFRADLIRQALQKFPLSPILRAATPWKSHFTDSDVTGDIHNYVDTGDGKRLWAQDADEIVKRHNEGTSEQAPQLTPELELEQEADGRWLAEYTRFPGVMAYGPTREEAIWNAAKVLIESEQASPDLMAVIERLANHGSVDDYTVAGIRAELRDALHNSKREPASPTPICGGNKAIANPWHFSAATQKGSTKD